jgi:hypothetical protein
MFNNKLILANKDLFISIFNTVGKNYNDFRQVVNNFDPPSLRSLAAWCLANNFLDTLTESIVSDVSAYLKKSPNIISNIVVKKDRVVILGEEFLSDPNDKTLVLRFSEFIHSNFPIERQTVNLTSSSVDMAPVLTGDGIKIYEVYNVNDARQAGDGTSWCIAYKGGENLWQNYRTGNAATFFIVHDENPPTPDQAKVAIDFNKTDVSLTDIPNHTGVVLSNGMNWDRYKNYLKSKNVNVDATRINPETNQEEIIFKNKPLLKKEIKLLSVKDLFQKNYKYYEKRPLSLETINNFRKGIVVIDLPSHLQYQEHKISTGSKPDLDNYQITMIGNGRKYSYNLEVEKDTPVNFGKNDGNDVNQVSFPDEDAKTYTYQLIGLGQPLEDPAFENMLSVPGGEKTIVQYINTGYAIPDPQEEKLKEYPKYYKSYVRKLLQVGNYEHVIENLEYDESELVNALNEENDKETLKKLAHLLYERDNTIKERYPEIFLYDKIDSFEQYYLSDFDDELSKKIALVNGVQLAYNSNNSEYGLLYILDKPALEKLSNDLKAKKYNLLLISDYLTKTAKSLFFSQKKREIKSFYNYNNIPLPDYYPETEYSSSYEYLIFKKELNRQLDSIYDLDRYPNSRLKQYANVANGEVYAGVYFNQEVDPIDFHSGPEKKVLFEFTDYESENEYTEYPLIKGSLIYLDRILSIYNLSKYDLLTGFAQSLGAFDDETIQLLFTRYSKKEVFDKISTINIDGARQNVFKFEEYFTCFNDFKSLAGLYQIRQKRPFDYYLSNITQEEINEHINDQDFINFIMFEKPEILSDEIIDNYIINNGLGTASKIILNQKILNRAYELWKERKLSPQDLGWNDNFIAKLGQERNQGLISDEDVKRIMGSSIDHDAIINNPSLTPEEKTKLLSEKSKLKTIEPPTEQPTEQILPENTPEENEEEPTIASLKTMVKIASKLDLKKKYKLADKITQKLRDYNVQS